MVVCGLGHRNPHHAQGMTQIGIRIGIDGQHLVAVGREPTHQKGGQRGLADSALAAHCDLHVLLL
jgi:hypothetical protein